MRLELVRSGGFAGLRQPASLDTAELPPAEAQQIEEALKQVDIAALERRSPIRGSGADRFQYDLTVTADGESHRLVVGESEVPEPLKPVLRVLQRRLRP